jgi:hypothetical protein
MLIDEAAEVRESAYLTVRPMLAMGGRDGGRLWLLSTPKGKQGFFFNTWENGGKTWFRVSVPATENPRFSQAFLEEERQTLGERWFGQEYLCKFVDTTTGLFGDADLAVFVRPDVPPLWD